MVRPQPNNNGVVLCPNCRSAFTLAQFMRPQKESAAEEGVIHDFTRRRYP
jgi:hypothetical protein